MKSKCREGAVCSKSSRRSLASPYRSDALVVDWEHVVVNRVVFTFLMRETLPFVARWSADIRIDEL